MKSQTPPQSGKLGDLVASRNHYGYYWRRRPSVPPKPTPGRRRAQQHFRAPIAGWDTLSEPTRLGFIRLAQECKSHPKLGLSSRLTGPVLYIKLNAAQAALDLPPVLEPPPLPQFGLTPVGALIITCSRGRIRLLLAVSSPPTTPIRLAASPPCNAGRYRCWDLRLLGRLPAPVNGYSDITAAYVARFGWPPFGKRIFVETRQQRDGWQDLPRTVNALVPVPKPRKGEIRRK